MFLPRIRGADPGYGTRGNRLKRIEDNRQLFLEAWHEHIDN